MCRKDFKAFGCTVLGSRRGQEREVTGKTTHLKASLSRVLLCVKKNSSPTHRLSERLRAQLLLALPGRPEVYKQLVVILGPDLTPVRDLPLHRPMKWPRGTADGFQLPSKHPVWALLVRGQADSMDHLS